MYDAIFEEDGGDDDEEVDADDIHLHILNIRSDFKELFENVDKDLDSE